jgi:hypothetical protein
VVKGLKSVIKIYKSRGFKVENFLGDGEFEPLRASIYDMGGQLNVTSNDEHVGDVERYIRTVKERARASYHSTPFKKLPVIMIQHLIGGSVFWLNAFPTDRGITNMSPRTIMTGKVVDYASHCKIMFGAYAQVHEQHNNSMDARTTGAIALRPTGNKQGGYYFMSLTTGRLLNRNHWTELPMPLDVIDRVHKLARQSYASKDLVFQFRDGTAVDDDDESAADPDYESADSDDDSEGSDEGNKDSMSDEDDDEHLEVESNMEQDDIIDGPAIPGQHMDVEIAGVTNDTSDEASDVITDGDAEEQMSVPDQAMDDTDNAEEQEMLHDEESVMDNDQTGVNVAADQPPEVVQHSYGLCPRKPRSYKHIHPDLEDVIMTQLSLKKGLVAYGEAGAAAVMRELVQLHNKDVMEPRAANMLTKEEKRRALKYLMYLKKKRCGRIKGRGCADGRKQRVYKSKEESSSPTVAIESVFLTAAIEAKERRDVATCDIPGAFLHAYIDEVLHMQIDGPMAKLLVEIDPA